MIKADAREQARAPGAVTGWKRLAGEVLRGSLIRKRVLILGTDHLALELCRSMIGKHGGAYKVVGFLHRDVTRVGERLLNPSIIGTFEQLYEIVEQWRVDTVAVCLEDRRGGLPVQTLLDLKAMGLEVVDGHDLYERESGRLSIDLLKPSSLIFSTGFRRFKVLMACKRLIDVFASTVGLIAVAPLFLVLAAIIRLDSPGPVFYRQVRVGFHGQPFVIWKFRSMRYDAEDGGVRWADVDDPRVTRVGRWLRRWRVDELPQLINVFKGEMSLIGPRPERPTFVQDLRRTIPYYDVRHTVRPGVSGWAQVRFQYAGSAEETHEKLQYDLYYVKNLSLILDLRILLETVRVMLQGAGAR